MDRKSSTTNQNYSEAEVAKQTDRLIRQTQASAMAAATINKAKESAENPAQVRNVKKYSSIDPDYLVSQENENPHATIDERYQHSAHKDKILGPVGLSKQSTKPSAKPDESLSHFRPRASTPQKRLPLSKLNTLSTQTKNIASRLKATQVSLSAISWVSYLWLGIQVPFAIIAILSFGVSAAFETASGITDIVNSIVGFVGLDFVKIASTLFLFSQVIILALGLICIFVLSIQYKLAGLNPFFGKGGSGFKIGMFLLTIVGYSMPALNLLPFIFLWMLAVWIYPR